MSDPFGLMQFAECEHKQLKCEKCGARSDIRGWQTFTGQDKELLQLREENESITARLAAAEADQRRWRYVRDNSTLAGETQEGVYLWEWEALDRNADSIDADVDASIEAAKGGRE